MANYAEKVLDSMGSLGDKVKSFGIEKVAEAAGIKPRIVKKFLTDPMSCKNSEIAKIRKAVEALES